jgi:hypothetical protein
MLAKVVTAKLKRRTIFKKYANVSLCGATITTI